MVYLVQYCTATPPQHQHRAGTSTPLATSTHHHVQAPLNAAPAAGRPAARRRARRQVQLTQMYRWWSWKSGQQDGGAAVEGAAAPAAKGA